MIIKKDLQRKEVLIKEERKRVKAHVKKKLEKSSCGTSSADSSHFPHPSGPSARTGGSAPSESEGAWKGLLDPLDSSYVARNGKQVNEKAVDWDWNDGTDYISPSHGKSLLHENEEDEKPLIKGDLNHEYLDTLQDCNEDYNFSENYLTNTHDSSLITPIIAIPSQEQAQSIFPPIDSAKSRGSKAPHVPLPSTDLAPSSLSVSFSQMISSHSRPNIPIGNIPVAVEKVLKRRKSNQIIQKENSK